MKITVNFIYIYIPSKVFPISSLYVDKKKLYDMLYQL